MAILGDSVRRKREELVRGHVEAENSGDFPAALLTFTHPRYEYVATDEVYDALAAHPLTIGRGLIRRATGR